MAAEQAIAAYRFASGEQRGSHFTLYAGRLVHERGDAAEHMPLAHLAAVRIEFAREPRKLKWAIIFLVAAVMLNAVFAPLQRLADTAATEVAEHARREGGAAGGVSGVLQVSFRALERGAAGLPALGLALGAWAMVLLALYRYGRTTLTLTLAAVEREYSVRGRERTLIEFAGALSTRLAGLTG